MTEELRALRTQMNLSGLSRKDAAGALFLSLSALNRKLRGELALTPGERRTLLALAEQRRGKALDRQANA